MYFSKFVRGVFSVLCYTGITFPLTLLHSEGPKLHRVLALLSAIALNSLLKYDFCYAMKDCIDFFKKGTFQNKRTVLIIFI